MAFTIFMPGMPASVLKSFKLKSTVIRAFVAIAESLCSMLTVCDGKALFTCENCASAPTSIPFSHDSSALSNSVIAPVITTSGINLSLKSE